MLARHEIRVVLAAEIHSQPLAQCCACKPDMQPRRGIVAQLQQIDVIQKRGEALGTEVGLVRDEAGSRKFEPGCLKGEASFRARSEERRVGTEWMSRWW